MRMYLSPRHENKEEWDLLNAVSFLLKGMDRPELSKWLADELKRRNVVEISLFCDVFCSYNWFMQLTLAQAHICHIPHAPYYILCVDC